MTLRPVVDALAVGVLRLLEGHSIRPQHFTDGETEGGGEVQLVSDIARTDPAPLFPVGVFSVSTSLNMTGCLRHSC